MKRTTRAVLQRPLGHLLAVPVWMYRKTISPLKPPCCRFWPTCSSYALQALRTHGALHGGWLTIRRLSRCHPFCEPGFDPVPVRRQRAERQRPD